MIKSSFQQVVETFGGGSLSRGFLSSRKWLPPVLIALFVVFSYLADLWPVKKNYFYVYSIVDNLLTMDLQVHFAMRYTAGNGVHSAESLLYVLVVKLFHLLIPFRVACLRAVSVCSTIVSLCFLYLIAKRLFSRTLALLFLLLLVTSPIYLESMRAFGFIPLTNTIVVISCYFFISSLEGKNYGAKLALAAFFGLLTLSLYLPGKLVILVPVIFFLLSLKKYWRHLLVFIVLVVVPVLVIDRVFGNIRFDLEYAFKADGEFLMYNPPLSRIIDRLKDNLSQLAGYLFQINRSFFREFCTGYLDEGRSRIFNFFYTPFFFIGLVASLKKRRPGGIFLLIWFALFFLSPLISSELSPRRFILALNPIYLIIAVGLWASFRFLYHLISSVNSRKLFAVCSVVFLAGTGGYDLFEFFFQVSRPVSPYSREELKEIAELIDREGRKAAFIVIDETRMADLIWGNPYFDRPLIVPEITQKFVYLNPLQDCQAYFPPVGEGVLYLFSLEGTRQSAEMADVIRQWEADGSGALSSSNVAGTGFYTVLSTGGTSIPLPENWAPAGRRYLKSLVDIPLRISSEYSTVAGVKKLRDRRPETFWRISNREVGQPAWIMIDLGPEGERAVRGLRALPREDHPEEFFWNAELLGSRDGVQWKSIAAITQDEIPPGDRWREWDFENEERYRYYKFVIHDGHSGRNNVFLSMAEFDIYVNDNRRTDAAPRNVQ